jgi:hypothetical protein
MTQHQDHPLNATSEGNNEQQINSKVPENTQLDVQANKTESQKRFDRGTDLDLFEISSQNEHPDEHNTNNDVATNDGSVLETLDTAFHDVPGFSVGENLSGSNRADYYEARSQSKSDTEEELEARRGTPQDQEG